MVKNPAANSGNTGSILGQEDPLEKEMAIHSSILAWEIPWTEEPGRLWSVILQKSQLSDFPGSSVIKNSPVNQEAWVQSWGQKDPLEKEMAIHSSILAWEVPWADESGVLQFMRFQESDTKSHSD